MPARIIRKYNKHINESIDFNDDENEDIILSHMESLTTTYIEQIFKFIIQFQLYTDAAEIYPNAALEYIDFKKLNNIAINNDNWYYIYTQLNKNEYELYYVERHKKMKFANIKINNGAISLTLYTDVLSSDDSYENWRQFQDVVIDFMQHDIRKISEIIYDRDDYDKTHNPDEFKYLDIIAHSNFYIQKNSTEIPAIFKSYEKFWPQVYIAYTNNPVYVRFILVEFKDENELLYTINFIRQHYENTIHKFIFDCNYYNSGWSGCKLGNEVIYNSDEWHNRLKTILKDIPFDITSDNDINESVDFSDTDNTDINITDDSNIYNNEHAIDYFIETFTENINDVKLINCSLTDIELTVQDYTLHCDISICYDTDDDYEIFNPDYEIEKITFIFDGRQIIISDYDKDDAIFDEIKDLLDTYVYDEKSYIYKKYEKTFEYLSLYHAAEESFIEYSANIDGGDRHPWNW